MKLKERDMFIQRARPLTSGPFLYGDRVIIFAKGTHPAELFGIESKGHLNLLLELCYHVLHEEV